MKKDKIITIRVSEKEKKRLTEKSKIAKLSLSEYLIEQGLDKEIVIVDGLNEVVAELRRIGNNINQLTYLANSGRIYTVDLSEVKQAVIIPGRAFVHQLDAERILSADGVERIVGRGPDTLTIDGELSFDKTDENVIEEELTQFNDLVDAINFFGMRI